MDCDDYERNDYRLSCSKSVETKTACTLILSQGADMCDVLCFRPVNLTEEVEAVIADVNLFPFIFVDEKNLLLAVCLVS